MPWPSMGSEDFSYILQHVPGAMVFLGATPADLTRRRSPRRTRTRSSSTKSAMPTGVALHVAMAERLLARG